MTESAINYINNLLNGMNPTEPLPKDPPWSNIAALLLNEEPGARINRLSQWIEEAGRDGERVLNAIMGLNCRDKVTEVSTGEEVGKLWVLDDLIVEKFDDASILVGEINNALVVRGEGHLIAGPAGVGKTFLVFDLALSLASGMNFLGFSTVAPLNVLILQTELPKEFVQARFLRLLDAYEAEDSQCAREAIKKIHLYDFYKPLDLSVNANRAFISDLVDQTEADVIFLDPFLTFFGGEENSNSMVRSTLDAIRYDIAERCQCALFITDHLAKSDSGHGARARGAGAKIDWASLVINLSHHKTPDGQRGQFVNAALNKVRYGWCPADPIILQRDPNNLRHNVWEPENGPDLEQVRQIIIDEGGEIPSQRQMIKRIKERLGVGGRRARSILDIALHEGIIECGCGRGKAKIYRFPAATESDPNQDDVDDN